MTKTTDHSDQGESNNQKIENFDIFVVFLRQKRLKMFETLGTF